MEYKCGLNVVFDDIYEAFTSGFSDYIIKFSLIKDDFKDRFFGPEGNSLLIGVLCINNLGKISFIWVENDYRCKGIASSVISFAVKELSLSKLFISFPNNSLLEGFLKKVSFMKDKISQYEMFLYL